MTNHTIEIQQTKLSFSPNEQVMFYKPKDTNAGTIATTSVPMILT